MDYSPPEGEIVDRFDLLQSLKNGSISAARSARQAGAKPPARRPGRRVGGLTRQVSEGGDRGLV